MQRLPESHLRIFVELAITKMSAIQKHLVRYRIIGRFLTTAQLINFALKCTVY